MTVVATGGTTVTHRPDGSDLMAAARAALAEPRPYTLTDVAAHVGLPEDELASILEPLRRMRDTFGERDLRYAELIATLRRYLPAEALVRSARVRQRAVAAVVTNDLAMVREHLLAPVLDDPDRDERIAEVVAMAAAALVPLEARMLALDYRTTLEHLLESDTVVRAAGQAGNEIETVIGFVDLVGYTKLSTGSTPRELGDALAQFEELVHREVARSECTWAVKLLGDAAMLCSEDVDDLVAVLLRIVDRAGPHPDLPRRGGLAAGPVIVRDGDYFGTPVNLAARLTAAAEPWAVLADEALHDQLPELLDVTAIPPLTLRGIGRRRPLRIRRADVRDAPVRQRSSV